MNLAGETVPTPLGEVVRFGNGKAIKPGGTGRYPVYGSNGIIGGSDDFRHENGVIIGRVGAYCGSVAYCPTPFWASDNTLVAYPASEEIDTRFLYYLLGSANLRNYAGGAAQPLVTQTVLKQVEVAVPDLPTQRRIAGILSAYDDLIENNLRRIRILEEMAQSLYREWFVHFRFPGHDGSSPSGRGRGEGAKPSPLVDSPLGPIPEGWEVKTFSEICSLITRGITPKYEDGSGRFAINQKANTGSEIRTEYLKEIREDLAVPEAKFARVGDMLINCLGEGTIGRVHYFLGPDREWAVDQHMSICRADDPHSSKLLFFYLDSPEGQAKIASVKSGGTNMTTFNISDLRSIQVVWPMSALLDSFGDQVEGLFGLKATLQRRNQTLRQTRDLLLSKLVSKTT